jgi:hypothetical protein
MTRHALIEITHVVLAASNARVSLNGGNITSIQMNKPLKTTDTKPEQQNEETMTSTSTPPSPQQPEVTDDDLAALDAMLATLDAVGRSLIGDDRVGDDLRYKEGKWTKAIGGQKVEISATATFVVDMQSFKQGWLKWPADRKSRPLAKMGGRPIDGYIQPLRERLDDQDERLWEGRDSSGKPQDSRWPLQLLGRPLALAAPWARP